MGVTIGSALIRCGHDVRWVESGRSRATAERAQGAGFVSSASLKPVIDGADVVFSVCPPSSACDVADEVAALGFSGIYVDANAVAPQTAQRVSDRIVGAGGHYVDGGIVGPPAHRAGSTRLYLSGPQAPEICAAMRDEILEVIDAGEGACSASSIKMCYAAYTKGSSALLLAVRALARALDVEDSLLGEWDRSQKGLSDRAQATARGTAPKAWRFTGEMNEIARTFASAGLPDGFHQAAEEIYERMASLKTEEDADLEQVLVALLAQPTRSD
jgi:3-hydroxyisobutyrate dehydrogenase-like beta-hydroxyacid dehydrogenase